MSNWNASHYLTYGDQRTRAALDLAARINLDAPDTIADLGCGPGNSSQILRTRWPHSHIVGIDNSPEMIASAKQSFPDQDWLLTDLSAWAPADLVDIIYSNAALQWLPNHDVLIRRLFTLIAADGALAFQVPSRSYAIVRALIHEISYDSAWTERMDAPRNALTMEDPSYYYDLLVADATNVDIWETEYNHVMDSKDSIVDWMASTGLRPFLAALNDNNERNVFLGQLHQQVSSAYQARRR